MITEERIKEIQAIDQAEQEKKKKVRKKLTKEEKDAQELNDMLTYDFTPQEELIEHPEKEWDVTLEDPIYYFDPELSYEITGYRPITKDKGLDFDPKVFTVAADTYRKNGRYTKFLPKTFMHEQYWTQEMNRCKNGLTVGKYRITGENYFWLNYYRLQSVISNNEGDELRLEDFPGFINKQYEYFHYLEMCRKLKMDGLAFKSRAVNKPAAYYGNII